MAEKLREGVSRGRGYKLRGLFVDLAIIRQVVTQSIGEVKD
jgi:hypothetical protein